MRRVGRLFGVVPSQADAVNKPARASGTLNELLHSSITPLVSHDPSHSDAGTSLYSHEWHLHGLLRGPLSPTPKFTGPVTKGSADLLRKMWLQPTVLLDDGNPKFVGCRPLHPDGCDFGILVHSLHLMDRGGSRTRWDQAHGAEEGCKGTRRSTGGLHTVGLRGRGPRPQTRSNLGYASLLQISFGWRPFSGGFNSGAATPGGVHSPCSPTNQPL